MKTGPQKFNKKNTLIMGMIGLFLGIVGLMFVSLTSIGPDQEPNYTYGYLVMAFLAITFGFWGSQMNRASSEKIELPMRFIRIAIIVSWIVIFYFKFRN